VPILDTSVAVTSRIYRGISPFTGGRDHLSHRLMRVGLTQKNAAITLWAATSVFCAAGLGIYYWPDNLGLPLIIGAGAIWTALLVWFLRIPSQD
jgi:UDP-GlcNAc:undecaprenyl-phosphate GlcNAc-1-phosphate transferase